MGNIFSIHLSCDTLINHCWDCVTGQAIYACHLEENLAYLKTALDELKDRRNDVMTEVNVAELQNLRPLDEVRGWLSRSQTMINEVDALLTDGPEQIKKLCKGIKIPRGLISGFPKLQTLRMFGSIPSEDIEWLAEELQCSKHFNLLTLKITNALALDRFLKAEMLHSCIQRIDLRSIRDSEQLNFLSLANMRNLNHMHLCDCESLEAPIQSQISVISTQRRFQNLESVVIINCSKSSDLTWLVVLAPNLSLVHISNCNKMEEIISELRLSQVAELVETLSPFAKLKSLRLYRLPELKSIYWEALPFPCLEDIDVQRCPKLRRLPLNSNSAKGSKISITGEEKWWKEVEWEDEDARKYFSSLFRCSENKKDSKN